MPLGLSLSYGRKSAPPTLAEQADAIYAATTSSRLRAGDWGTYTAPGVPETPTEATVNELLSIVFAGTALQRLNSNISLAPFSNAVIYAAFSGIVTGEAGYVAADNTVAKYIGFMFNGSTNTTISASAGGPTIYAQGAVVTTRDEVHDGMTGASPGAKRWFKATGCDISGWGEINFGGNGGAPGAYLVSNLVEAGIIQNPTAGQIAILDAYYAGLVA